MFQHTHEEIIVGPRVGKWHSLAEAIRLGCYHFPNQEFGEYYGSRSACAIGAAASALRILPNDVDCPMILVCPIRPGCESLEAFVPINMVVHLNDDHRWTRERIADWLDTL
jgi:hypothetical protein